MSKKITALFLVMAMAVCMVVPVMAETTSWNTPTTTNSDEDKTSICEVTADVHYAYYVSMPATLSLEPGTGTNEYVCDYQVKAKADSTLLASKNIKIAPPANVGLFKSDNYTTTADVTATIAQGKQLFGDTPSATVEKVDGTKWAAIDGKVTATIPDQGTYKGNFDFTYGLETK